MDTQGPNQDHGPKHDEYDGIVENDNPMPRWWLATFYLTIAFGAVYYVAVQFMGKMNLADEYATEMAEYQKKAPSTALSPAEAEAIEKLVADARAITKGRAVFIARCALCHADDGGGNIGPNLTDNFWIHGQGKAGDMVPVILNGVDGLGMPPWKLILSQDEVREVTAFILTLRGVKPAKPKAPQGNEVKL